MIFHFGAYTKSWKTKFTVVLICLIYFVLYVKTKWNYIKFLTDGSSYKKIYRLDIIEI